MPRKYFILLHWNESDGERVGHLSLTQKKKKEKKKKKKKRKRPRKCPNLKKNEENKFLFITKREERNDN